MEEKCFCHITDADGNVYLVKDRDARSKINALFEKVNRIDEDVSNNTRKLCTERVLYSVKEGVKLQNLNAGDNEIQILYNAERTEIMFYRVSYRYSYWNHLASTQDIARETVLLRSVSKGSKATIFRNSFTTLDGAVIHLVCNETNNVNGNVTTLNFRTIFKQSGTGDALESAYIENIDILYKELDNGNE